MKRILTLLCLSLASLASFAQQTFVPDDAFEQKLIDLGFDDVLDDYVLTSNISPIRVIWLSDLGITDMTGIEDFTSMEELYCYRNEITTIDVSNLSALKIAFFPGNKLTTLDLSANTQLVRVHVDNNELTSLDLRNGNNINFTNHDFRGNPDLTVVEVDDLVYSRANWTKMDADAIYSLARGASTYVPDDAFEQALIDKGYDDVLDNYVSTDEVSYIKTIWLGDLAIKDMTGIEDFVSMENLYCYRNEITSIDVSNLSQLKIAFFPSNNLQTLDLSANALLVRAHLDKNELTSLNIKNGNNINFTDHDFRGNAGLTCIEVDDPIFSAANWTKKDADAMYSAKCGYTYVPDDAFESALIEFGYDDVLDDYVLTANISGVEKLNVSSRGIVSMQGIEDFIALWRLQVSRNDLVTLDVSKNINLSDLSCYENHLTEIDLGESSKLWNFSCDFNELTELNLTNKTNLWLLSFSYNNIKYIDLDDCVSLEALWPNFNPLMELNLENLIALELLGVQATNITELDVSHNLNLESFACLDNDNLASLNLKNGNNYNLELGGELILENNPNLSCVEVDDVAYSNANWFVYVDPQVTFSTDCGSSPREGVELTNELLVTVVPNTVTDYMHVTLEHSAASYDLYDMSGSKMKSGELLEGGNDLDLSDLSSGAYILKVYTSSSVSEERIIKL